MAQFVIAPLEVGSMAYYKYKDHKEKKQHEKDMAEDLSNGDAAQRWKEWHEKEDRESKRDQQDTIERLAGPREEDKPLERADSSGDPSTSQNGASEDSVDLSQKEGRRQDEKPNNGQFKGSMLDV